jgi:putative methyltransferase
MLYVSVRFTSAYLPYGCGQLWAYASQSDLVRDTYTLAELLFLRTDPAEAAARLEEPFLVGFSCYSWNTEYNKALAKEIKKLYPACLTVFGGHNVPPDCSFFDFPYVDFLVRGEGEIPFRRLLEELAAGEPDFRAVPGLAWRTDDGCGCENAPAHLLSLEDVPSPFLTGVFDSLMQAHPEIQWSTVWETNRGCPYKCAYCDWGLLKSKIRCFSMQRILDEIQWFTEKKVEFLWGADANFGIFERDEPIAQALADAKSRTGYPLTIYVNYAKNDEERVFRIAHILNGNNLSRVGSTISFQSMSPEVLANIGRKNLNYAHFQSLMKRYKAEGIRCYTELILGLPGETLESFCRGFGKLYELGQHDGIEFYNLCLLPNSPLAQPAMREKFSIQTKAITFIQPQAESLFKIKEYNQLVVSTNTMTNEDRLKAMLFGRFVQGVHGYALLRCIAIYLYHVQGIAYERFYTDLLAYFAAHPETIGGTTVQKIDAFHRAITDNSIYDQTLLPELAKQQLEMNNFTFGTFVLHFERFFRELEPFLASYRLPADLVGYQKALMRLPNRPDETLPFAYDYPAFFRSVYAQSPQPLEHKPVRVHFSDPHPVADWQHYYDVIIFQGRLTSRALRTAAYAGA